jgi:hypothetical protein
MAPDDRALSDSREPVALAPRPLGDVFRGSSRDVGTRVAELKAELETWIDRHPDDYWGLVMLGELNLRVGMNRQAQALLYRATLLKPPSWEAYQRASLLLRRAETDRAHTVERTGGAPPPRWLLGVSAAIAPAARRLLTRTVLRPWIAS